MLRGKRLADARAVVGVYTSPTPRIGISWVCHARSSLCEFDGTPLELNRKTVR